MRFSYPISRILPLLICLAAAAAVAPAQTRMVTGKVVAQGGEPLEGAVIQIKNLQSLEIRSFLARADGSFQFTGLNPDIDYEVKASYRGRWSKVHSVSRFSSKPVVEVLITIDLKPR